MREREIEECARLARMATLVESADITEPLCGSTLKMSSQSPSSLNYRFDDSRFYLLVVVGEIVSEEHLRCAIADIEKGKARALE